MLKPSKILKAILFFITLISVSCRTASPKKGRDALNDQDLKNIGSPIGPGLDDESSGSSVSPDASLSWSPASRRANAMFQFLVAEKQLHEGNPAAAESRFQIAYNLDPNSYTGAQLVRSKILVDPKNPDGVREAHRMSLLYPQDATLKLLYGQALLVTDDYKEGEIQFKKAIELNPKIEDAYLALIKCYQLQGKNEAAIEVANRMVKSNPGNVQAWSILSRVLLSGKKYKEALNPAQRAWELQENNPELALIYGLTLDLNKRGKEAVKLYEQLYRFNPGNPELVQRMMGLYRELGDLSTALTLIDDMIENSKEPVPGLKMQKIIVLWELQKNREALQIAQELEKELPDSDRVLFISAICYEKMNKHNESIERFSKIQNDSPLKMDAMKQQSLLLNEAGRETEAFEILNSLSERKDCEPIVFLIWGEMLAQKDKFKDAVIVLDRGLSKFSDHVKLLFTKGAYQERSGDKRGAEATMRLVIERNPKDSTALNFLGYMLAEEGRELDEAEQLVRRAILIQPKNGGFLDSLGWIYYQKKDYKRALETLNSAVALETEEGVIWEHLADTFLALGDKKSAIIKLKEALSRKNEQKDQERIQKKYDALKVELP